MLVKEIYHKNAESIQEEDTIRDIVRKSIDQAYNGFLVKNSQGKLVGILSIQDIVASVVPEEMKKQTRLANAMYLPNFFKEMCEEIATKKAKDIMRKNFISVNLQANVMQIAADFLQNDLYIVPVVENKEIVGIITRSELKKAMAIAMDIPLK